MKKARIILHVFFVLNINAFIGVFFPSPAIATTNSNQQNATFVEVATVQAKTLQKQVMFTGSLRANQGIAVRPEIAGRVTQIYFKSGEMVVAGAPLVQLNKDILEAQLSQSKYALELAKLNYERMATLYKARTIPKVNFDTAYSQANTARAAVAQYQAMLDQTLIKAPFAGRLGLSAISLGYYLTAGQDIVKLESVDPIEVEFSVSEIYLHQLAINKSVKIFSDIDKSHFFTGKIYAIDAEVNLNNRTVTARATLPNREGKLLPGMFVKVSLDVTSPKPALLIPQVALFYDNGEANVYKVVNNKALKTRVLLGERDGESVEVLGGLNSGDVVVTAGQMNLDDGAAIITNGE